MSRTKEKKERKKEKRNENLSEMDENMRIDIAEDSKEKQAEGRISARWLGRSEIISRGTIKT